MIDDMCWRELAFRVASVLNGLISTMLIDRVCILLGADILEGGLLELFTARAGWCNKGLIIPEEGCH